MKNPLSKFGAWASTLPILLLPVSVLAQNPPARIPDGGGAARAGSYLDEVGGKVAGQNSATLPQVIGNLINVLLSVLGILFVVLVVYAGYLYLTAAGDTKKVDKAKALLGQAVIGMVIIIAAYAISDFVIDNLVGVANR